MLRNCTAIRIFATVCNGFDVFTAGSVTKPDTFVQVPFNAVDTVCPT